MATSEIYQKQVALLVQALPHIAEEPDFALKGGTAINLFVRDLPRLSVDIDLTYLPIEDRTNSLAAIDAAIGRVAARLRDRIPGARVTLGHLRPEGVATKLVLRAGGTQIKVEVTPVLRGCVHEPKLMATVPTVEEAFGFAEVLVVSFEDLYAGKMVAALDRQHPRDLFDIRGLLAAEGLTEALRNTFPIYVVSHNRPAVELLSPRHRDIESELRTRFDGMTREPVSLTDLLAARDELVSQAVTHMPDHHRHFLVSVERGEPDWDAMNTPRVKDLPAVRWKLINIMELSEEVRKANAEALAKIWS